VFLVVVVVIRVAESIVVVIWVSNSIVVAVDNLLGVVVVDDNRKFFNQHKFKLGIRTFIN
jgi:hypothetical protein